jgi:phospholipase C
MCLDGPAPLAGQVDRCGPGPRLPLLVISPYAKRNFIDHTLTTQASVTRFIEDNWRTGRLGGGSFDATAGSLTSVFDFRAPQQRAVLLASDGSVAATVPVRVAPGSTSFGPVPARGAGGGPTRAGGAAPGTGGHGGPTASAADVHDVAWTGTDSAWLIGVLAVLVGSGVGFWLTRRRRGTTA